MRRDTLLVLLTVAGSALSWWPVLIEPSLDLPWWLPLAIVPLCTGFSTFLSGGRCLRLLTASAIGTFAGLCGGFAIWWPSDPIAGPWVKYDVIAGTLATILLALAAGLAGYGVAVLTKRCRPAVWIALACCVAFGPIALALTPPLVAYRVARNDHAATERFWSLKRAVEQTVAESGDMGSICNPQALKRHYSGPPFSRKELELRCGKLCRGRWVRFRDRHLLSTSGSVHDRRIPITWKG